MFKKEIVYDEETRDWTMYLADELIGYARSYHEAEIVLDQVDHMVATSGIWYEDEKTDR